MKINSKPRIFDSRPLFQRDYIVIAPNNNFKQHPFVDREDHIQTFKEAVTNIGQKDFSVLVYCGVAGIGKTSLRKEFTKHLEEYNQKNQPHEVIWASINLHLDQYREKKYLSSASIPRYIHN